MASCSRTHAFKAALLVGFLLILLNLLGSRWDSTPIGLPRPGSTQWPKRTRPSSERFIQYNEPAQSHQSSDTADESTRRQSNESSNHTQSVNPTGAQTHSAVTIPSQSEVAINLVDKNLSDARASMSPDVQKPREPHPTDVAIQAALPSSVAVASNKVESSDSHTNTTFSSKNLTNLSSHSENLIDGNNSSRSNVVTASSPKQNIPEAKQEALKQLEPEDNSVMVDSLVRTRGLSNCPPIPPNLDGPIEVDTTYESVSSVEQKLAPKLQPGGQYTPRECSARDRVAIIVPYRDREQHLPVFLKNIHAFLMKQQIEYGIYIVEQAAGTPFNRASLMNVGFVEAMKQKPWDCMVFHDVDLLPMDDRNLYTCPDQPRHMSVAVDTFGFKLPYSTIFGGVSAMTMKQFRTVNGFSNSFWGWGGEDDDMSNRLKHVGFHIARYPINIARYTMLSHKKEKANPKRYEKLITGTKRFDSDGLNSLHYKLVNLVRKPLYTWIHVEISPDSS